MSRSVFRSAFTLAFSALALGLALPSSADAAGFSSPVTTITVTPNGAATTMTGDLSSGKTMALTWAAKSSVACFPATEFVNFKGKHVMYGLSIPKQSELKVTVTPKNPSLDVNVYAYTIGSTDFTHVAPNVSTAVSCEAGYDQVTDSNPGKAESVKLNATTNPYNVVIGVAGPQGVTSGEYTLSVELKAATEVQSAKLTTTPMEVGRDVSGDLSKGGVIDLAFAAKSSMACWPATENLNFTGNHVLYSLSLPKQTEMTITATPDSSSTDLSLYAYTVSSTGTAALPPDVSSAVSCEAGYDQKTDHNPGVAETVKLIATTNSYQVIVGVAGAGTTKSGTFKLKATTKAR